MRSRHHRILGNVARRREVAAKLKAEREYRTPEQQLARLNAGGWTAAKERAKLKAMIAIGQQRNGGGVHRRCPARSAGG